MLKGPKRSFVVVVLVLGVETWVKNALNGTKNVRKQNLLQIEQKMCMGTKNVQGNKKCASVAHYGI